MTDPIVPKTLIEVFQVACLITYMRAGLPGLR